jgi:hypothetical protein
MDPESLGLVCLSHVRAFEFFQGTSRLIVPDNWKSGVKKPCYYEPELNRPYNDLAIHYGVGILPARPRRPKDKAKAESECRWSSVGFWRPCASASSSVSVSSTKTRRSTRAKEFASPTREHIPGRGDRDYRRPSLSRDSPTHRSRSRICVPLAFFGATERKERRKTERINGSS